MKLKWNLNRQGFALLVLTVLLIGASGCAMMKSYHQVMAPKRAQYRNTDLTRQISPQELREDLRDLITTLEAVHPHPYAVLSPTSFRDNLEKLNQSLGATTTPPQETAVPSKGTAGPSQMTSPSQMALPSEMVMASIPIREFYLKLAPLLVSMEQDYTCLQFPQEAYRDFLSRNGKLLPFEVAVTGEKLKVKTNFSTNPIAPGAEIESINDVPAGEIIKNLLQYCEGSTMALRNQRLSKDFQALLWLVYNFQEPYNISIDTRWLSIPGVTISQIRQFQRLHSLNDDIWEAFDYQRLGEAVGLLAIGDFNPADFALNLENAFTKIARDEIADLIIDVRNNRSGASPQVEQLIEYLWDRPYVTISAIEQKRSRQYDQQLDSLYYWWAKLILQLHPATKGYYQTPVGQVALLTMDAKDPRPVKWRFRGRVYVLTGPNTGSSGTEFASIIKDYRMGMLIGQPTGASANEYGNPYEFVLPHSRLWVSAATSYSIRPSGERTIGGLPPDIEVPVSPDETESGVEPSAQEPTEQDPVLETTKKIIALNRKPK